MSYSWIPLAAIVPGFFLWATLHEAAHALTAKLTGTAVIAFRPYPHIRNGRFYFASVTFETMPRTLVHIAPYLLDFIAFTGTAVGFWFVEHQAVAWSLATIAALPLVNTANAVYGRYRSVNETVDLARVSWGVATPFFWGLLVYCVVVGAMVLRLVT
jgi:hypothetical protein